MGKPIHRSRKYQRSRQETAQALDDSRRSPKALAAAKTFGRASSAGLTSPPIKTVDQATRALIDAALDRI